MIGLDEMPWEVKLLVTRQYYLVTFKMKLRAINHDLTGQFFK